MRIAVYPGSFDPLHIGHEAIMRYLTCESGFDWVYLIISPQNPFKDASKALNARERYEAAVKAVLRHPDIHVWVDDIELTMPAPQYTIRTLDALREREPGNCFTLIMGADNLAGIRLWKDADRLLKEYGIAVYPRSGFDMESLRSELLAECPDYLITTIDAPIVDISSTQIREGRSRGDDMSEYLM